MKEDQQLQFHLATHNLTKTRSGSRVNNEKRVHQRGDKVVVNGAKESLMAILRRYICECGKHSLEKVTSKFLSLNKVSASYDLVVWMFIFMKINCATDLYEDIIKEYLGKMNKKRDEDETHHSAKYVESKKVTLKKFIISAESLSNHPISSQHIQKSVNVLYSKGKSKDDAVKKIIDHLKKFNRQFKKHGHLQFQQCPCSFTKKTKSSSFNPMNQPETLALFVGKNQEKQFGEIKQEEKIKSSQFQKQEDILSSPNFCQQKNQEVQIFQTEKSVQEMKALPKDQPNKFYIKNKDNESLDLFDELILEESVDSLTSSYLFCFID